MAEDKLSEFLQDLYSTLSSSIFQYHRSRYNVANIEDWNMEGKPQGLEVNVRNFPTFLKKIYFHLSTDYDITSQDLTTSTLEKINQIIEITLRSNISIQQHSDTLFVKGHNVKFSDFIDEDGKLNDPSQKLKRVIIFALSIVFIDRDLNAEGQELQVIIISPEWQIHGERKINLNGAHGESFAVKTADDGKSGSPGLPGGAGGYFFGVANDIINSPILKINVSGGNGGPGQNGGTGKPGANGHTGILEGLSDPYCREELCESGHDKLILKTEEGTAEEFTCVKPEGGFRTPMHIHYTGGTYHGVECDIVVLGQKGEMGEKGGDGGIGGEGGHHGVIKLIVPPENPHNVRRIEADGMRGVNGTGGNRGTTGTDGKHISYMMSSDPGIFLLSPTWSKTKKYTYNEGSFGTFYSHYYRRGKDGGNDDRITKAKLPKKLAKPGYMIVNKYKSFVRRNLHYSFIKDPLIKFLQAVDETNNLYGTIGLAQELKDLERDATMLAIKPNEPVDFYTRNELKKSIDLTPFYESLLQRIRKQAQKIHAVDNPNEHKRILSYAYASALGRIHNLQDHSAMSLVVKIIPYLQFVQKGFEGLKRRQELFTTSIENVKKIEEFRERRITSIDEKIQEATTFIETIKSEFDNIHDEIDRNIEGLVQHIQDLEYAVIDERDKLEKMKDQMRIGMFIKVIQGAVKFASVAANVFGPVGTAAGAAIAATSSAVDSLLPSGEQTFAPNAKLDKSIQSIKNSLDTLKQDKIDELKKVLKKLPEETKGHEEVFKDTLEDAAKLQRKLDEYDKIESVVNAEKQFRESLDKKEQSLEQGGEKKKKPLDIIKNVKKLAKLGPAAFEFYSTIKKQIDEKHQVEVEIQDAEKKFEDLKDYEQAVYNDMKPTLEQLQKSVQDAMDDNEGKSGAALIVSKWNVQKSLRDIKLRMRAFTKGYDKDADLQRSIDKLEELMTTLTSLYDYIQNYQEEKELTDFSAGITALAAKKILFNDTHLAEAENNMKIAVSSNLLLKQYRTAIEAFKQYAFPFVSHYFKEIELPSDLTVDKYFDEVVLDAGERIEKLIARLEEKEPSDGNFIECFGQGPFKRGVIGLGPFITWKNDKYNDTIAKLLSGEEVLLYANVERSPALADAIKFNEVNFDIVAVDQQKQSQLDLDLQGFRLTLDHTGDSYYRYFSDVYKMTTDKLQLTHHLQKQNGKPIHEGVTNSKVKNGHFVISPYTLWKVRLESLLVDEPGNHYDVLKKYRNNVDLDLEGFARYMFRGRSSCRDSEIHKYYEAVDVLRTAKFSLNKRLKSKIPKGHITFGKHRREKREAKDDGTDERNIHNKVYQYASNSASSLVSSPITSVINWIKDCSKVIVSNLLESLNSSYKVMDKNLSDHEDDESYDADIYYDAMSTGEEETQINDDETRSYFLSIENNNAFLRKQEGMSYSHQKKVDGQKHHGLQNFLEFGKSMNNYESPNFEGQGLLMLADLLSRSFTGEKYKQAIPICLMEKRAMQIHDLKEQVYAALDMEASFNYNHLENN